MFETEIRYIEKILALRSLGFDVIENVPFEIIQEENTNGDNNSIFRVTDSDNY